MTMIAGVTYGQVVKCGDAHNPAGLAVGRLSTTRDGRFLPVTTG